jgi:hypothetical protein
MDKALWNRRMMTVPSTDSTINTKHVHTHANAAGVEFVVPLAILLAATHAMMKAQNTSTNDKIHAIVITFFALVTKQHTRFRQHSVKSATGMGLGGR